VPFFLTHAATVLTEATSSMTNPYAPPATVSTVQPASAAPRPVSIWLQLIVFSVLTSLYAFGLARALTSFSVQVRDQTATLEIAFDIAWRLALLAAFISLVVAIFRCRPWGRWVGLLPIGAMLLQVLLGSDSTNYANEAERTGGMFGQYVLMPAFFCWWGYAVAFSTKAQRYFGLNQPETEPS
jgi:hypothetical protein